MTANEDLGRRGPKLDINNVVAAFSEEQVERIVGLARSRLRYWARTNFFRPSFVEEGARLPDSRFYSFKDIVALRTLERLRVQNGVPLQHLRKVAERLSHLSERLWTATTLYVQRGKVVVVGPDDETPREVLTDQYVLELPLAKVIADTEAQIVALSARSPETYGRVTRSRNIVRNAWVVAGTRVPVDAIKRLREDGYGIDEIIAEYPDLTPADVRAALSHEADVAA